LFSAVNQPGAAANDGLGRAFIPRPPAVSNIQLSAIAKGGNVLAQVVMVFV